MSDAPDRRIPYSELPVLETERLILRALTWDDLDPVYEYGRDPEVTRFVFETLRSPDDARDFLYRVLETERPDDIGPWALVRKEDVRMIGACGLVHWSRKHNRAEAGYALARASWGQGYAAEALRAVIDFAFNQVGLNRVEAMCMPANTASWRVMEKAGMKREGLLRGHTVIKGAPQDVLIYGILRSDFTP